MKSIICLIREKKVEAKAQRQELEGFLHGGRDSCNERFKNLPENTFNLPLLMKNA